MARKIPPTKTYPQPIPSRETGGLGDKVANTISTALANLRLAIGEWLEDRFIDILWFLLDAIADTLAPIVRPVISEMRESGEVPESLRPLLDELESPSHAGVAGALVGIAASIGSTGIGTLLNARLAPLGYWGNRKWRPARVELESALVLAHRYPEIAEKMINDLRDLGLSDDRIQYLSRLVRNYPDILTLQEALRRGDMTEGEARQQLHEQGFDNQDASRIIRQSRRFLGVGEAKDLYLRGDISEEEHDARLRREGLDDPEIALLKRLYYYIPPAQDLITMAVREAFSPESVAQLGLDQDFPHEFAEWAAKQGISEEWARMYWRAHWQLPSATMGFEMLHRGIISEDELKALLKALDYTPVWRDKLIQLSHSPYTRVDVRRMYQMGILTDEQVFQSYKDLGYDDEHAANLTAFTISYASETERDLTKSDIINGYKDGILTRDNAQYMLMAMGYDENESEFYLVRADLDLEDEARKQNIENIHTLYTKRYIDENEARSQLSQLGLGGLEIERLMDKWTRERVGTIRTLTKSDVRTAYEMGLFTREKTLQELEKINYPADIAEQIVAIWDNEAARKAEEAAKPKYRWPSNAEIKKLLYQGIITEAKARQILEFKRYSPEAVDYYIASWAQEQAEREAEEAAAAEARMLAAIRKPSRAEIMTLYFENVIDLDRATEMLHDLNYTDDVVNMYRALWTTQKAEIEAIEAERQARAEEERPRLLTRAQLHELYISGFITVLDTRDYLTLLGYDPLDVERTVAMWQEEKAQLEADAEERARRELEPPPRLLSRAQVGDLYKTAIVTRDEAEALLVQLNYEPVNIERTLARWDQDIEREAELAAEREAREAEIETRVLTVSQTKDMFLAGVLTEADARGNLSQLGYSEEDVERFITRWKMQLREIEVEPERPLTVSQVESLFKDRILSVPEVRAKLRALRYGEADIDNLVTQWTLELQVEQRQEPKRLTVTQVKQLFQASIITETDARQELAALGYSEVDVERLINFFKRTGGEQA